MNIFSKLLISGVLLGGFAIWQNSRTRTDKLELELNLARTQAEVYHQAFERQLRDLMSVPPTSAGIAWGKHHPNEYGIWIREDDVSFARGWEVHDVWVDSEHHVIRCSERKR